MAPQSCPFEQTDSHNRQERTHVWQFILGYSMASKPTLATTLGHSDFTKQRCTCARRSNSSCRCSQSSSGIFHTTTGLNLRLDPSPRVASNSTDCEPMCSFVMFTRVLWRTLMKGSWSLFIELTQISISTKKKKAKLHYSGSKDCTNEQMFRSVLFSGLRDQFVVCHYCHNPSDKCK